MAWTDIFKRNKQETRSGENLASQALPFVARPSGVMVTSDTASTLSAVYRAWSLRSSLMASLPLEVLRNTDKGYMPAHDHRLHKSFRKPNNIHKGFDLRQIWETDICIYGNAYGLIDFKANKITYIPVKDVTIYYSFTKDVLYYKITGHEDVYTPDYILHFKNMSIDGIVGRSPIAACRETLSIGLSAQQASDSYYQNGTALSGVLSTEQKLHDKQVQEMNEYWKGFSGYLQSGGTPVLHSGIKYQQVQPSAADMQYLEARKFTLEEVCRIYGIPASLLNDLSRQTHHNMEHQGIEFATYSVRTWAKQYEEELEHKLLSDNEVYSSNRVKIKYNLNALMRADARSRAEYFSKIFSVGAVSSDQIAQLEDLSLGAEDMRFVQHNLKTLKEAKDLASKSSNNEE